jgi:hypothetical protein
VATGQEAKVKQEPWNEAQFPTATPRRCVIVLIGIASFRHPAHTG